MTGKLKKALLPNLPYLLFVWLFDKLCQAVRLSPGADASEKLLRIAQGFTGAFVSLWLSLHPLDLLLGVAGAALVRLAVYLKAKNAKKYRRGVEYGSARWGRPEDTAPYIDPVPDWNIPLTRTESLTMTSRPKDPKTARNKNILSSAAPAAARQGSLSSRPCSKCTAPMWSLIPKGSSFGRRESSWSTAGRSGTRTESRCGISAARSSMSPTASRS